MEGNKNLENRINRLSKQLETEVAEMKQRMALSGGDSKGMAAAA